MARLCFVLCLVFTCSVSGQSPYGLMGLKVTLKPEITATKQPDEILWKHNGNKVVEFDGRNQQEFGLFENRVTLDWISAELSITGLRLDDSGLYDLEFYADKVLKRQTLNLVVLEKLAKPNITCEMIKGSSSTDGEEATLTCSLESRQPQYLTYEWISHGPGPWLTVPRSNKNKEYTCMVRNPLSNATAKVTAKDYCPYEDRSALIIGLIVAVVLLVADLVAIVGIIYCMKNNKACFIRDVEKTSAERYDLNSETPHNEERASLIHRTPTVPSGQRLGRQLLSNKNMSSDLERSDTGNVKLCKQEIPAEAPLRKSSCEGSNGSNEADAEQLDPSHSEQETEAGGDFTGLNSEAPQSKQSIPPSEPTAPSAQQPVSPPQDDTNMTSTWDEPDNNNDQTDKEDGQSRIPPEGNVQKLVSNFVNNPDNQTDTKQSFCAETKQLDPLHPEQGTEAGLNSEAPQSKQSIPPSEPTAPSAQQPVSPPQDDTNMTATWDEPDNNNDQTDQEDGQSQMPQKGNVQKLISNIENSPNNQTDQLKQVRKDGDEQPPAKKTVMPPVPKPRLSQKFPPVGTKVTTEHKEGADSNQVTDKTEVENVELSESEKNNDLNKNSQIGKSVSDQTNSDNNQSQSPPSPEKPDQSNCGELQESPDATHSDLDQQTQDKTGCDSPESEEQSDNTTVSKENKGKDGDTDDNEGQCSAKLKQSHKESDDEETQETRLEQSDEESEDT